MTRKLAGFASIGLFLFVIFTACENTYNPIEATGTGAEDDTNTGSIDNSNAYTLDVGTVMQANCEIHEQSADYTLQAAGTSIELADDAIVITGTGAVVSENQVNIQAVGTYQISGTLTNGQLIVNTQEDGIVRLVLNGVHITNSSNAPVWIQNADKTIIYLADQSDNTLTDASTYVYENPEDDEPDAALFSQDDLTICGPGALTVNGQYSDGIASKDGLIIQGGSVTVQAADDGIRGKDYLVIKEGQITVDAQGDGLKSSNEDDATKGYVLIVDGDLNITALGDAITAVTDVAILDGDLNLKSGRGSSGWVAADASAKGIKSGYQVVIDGGHFSINSADDGIHSNENLCINDGVFEISTGDDGVHADSLIGINGGEISIPTCYEGIESKSVIIYDGVIHVVSTDDGLNAADGTGGDAGWGGGRPGGGGWQIGGGDNNLYINGGTIILQTVGDGIDINGSVVMTAGLLLIHGPIANMNGAIDYDGSFKISGGTVIAAGSSGMAQAPSSASTQNSVLINFTSGKQANTLIHIEDNKGNDVLTFAPKKQYASLAYSSSELKENSTYKVYFGGSSTGTDNDGLYSDGEYTPGSEYTSFTIDGVVTKIGR